MDEDLLDNDGIKRPNTNFFKFIKEEKLYSYTIVNLLLLSFCIYSFFRPNGMDSIIYLIVIYMANNVWLFLSYLSWKDDLLDKHYNDE